MTDNAAIERAVRYGYQRGHADCLFDRTKEGYRETLAVQNYAYEQEAAALLADTPSVEPHTHEFRTEERFLIDRYYEVQACKCGQVDRPSVEPAGRISIHNLRFLVAMMQGEMSGYSKERRLGWEEALASVLANAERLSVGAEPQASDS